MEIRLPTPLIKQCHGFCVPREYLALQALILTDPGTEPTILVIISNLMQILSLWSTYTIAANGF